MRTQGVRDEIQRLLGQVPFRPFAITLENGHRIEVEHSENITSASGESDLAETDDFYVRTRDMRLYSNFEAVTSIMVQDENVNEE